MSIHWKRLHLPAVALAVALMAGSAAPARAFDYTGIYLAPKFVYGLQVTDSTRQSGTLDHGWGSSTKSVFGGGVALGYNWDPIYNRPVRLEVEYLAFGNAKTKKSDASASGGWLDYTQRVGVQSLLFNLYWDIRNSTRWTPYLNAGLGMSFLSMKASNHRYDAGGVPTLALDTGYNDRSRFAWNVGAGVAFTVNERLSIDLGYRYADYGRARSDTVSTGAFTLAGRSDVTMHQFLLGARISF
ncbi:MAG: porin family protein [Desulfovibrionaceae bacterium]|nr:porin family protein [Desulfovibrionaceae bacterium]